MSEFTNLPGHYVYKEDGNYSVLNTVAGDVTLILGTAPEGPFGMQLIADSQEAQNLYDPSNLKTGTLLKGMYEALQTGAKYVALYRLGAQPAAVDFLNGYTIIVDGDPSDYKVFIDVDPLAVVVYDNTTGIILHDSLNGVTSTNVTVSGSLAEGAVDVRTGGTGVANFAEAVRLDLFKDFVTNGVPVTGSVTNDGPHTKVGNYIPMEVVDASNFSAGQIVQDGVGAYYLVSHVTNGALAADKVVYLSDVVTFSSGEVLTTVNAESIADGATITVVSRYVGDSDGLSMTPNETYTALQRAYWDLESAQVDVVVPEGVYANTANVINNEGVWGAQSALTHLGKAYKFETLGQIYMVYANGSETVGETFPAPYEMGIDSYEAKAWVEGTHTFDEIQGVTSDSDILALEDDMTFTEINFAHQLATYCYDLSLNDNEVSGVVAMKPYANLTRPTIMTWLGKLPVKDAEGVITRSGTGVLGYKLIAGSLGQKAGIFYTANELYGGTALISAQTNLPMDIGYLIDVVSTPVFSNTVYVTGSSGELTDGASAYAGLLGKYEKNIPLMRKSFPTGVISVAYKFSKKYLDQLIEARTVAFTIDSAGTTRVVDSPTASLVTSDYKSRFSVRVVQGVIDVVRAISDPYIGKLTTPYSISNLQEDIISGLKALQTPGPSQYLIAGSASVVQTTQQRIDGEAVCRLTLKVPGELRRITTYVLLER